MDMMEKPTLLSLKLKNIFLLCPQVNEVYFQRCLLLKLILVLPATNATSEHSFSALRRVKSYLRNTMGQKRLNTLMVLHVHKDLTDKLNLKDVANEFVGAAECRLSMYGKFK